MNCIKTLLDEKIIQARKDLEKATKDFTEDIGSYSDYRYYFGRLMAFEEIKKECE